MNREEDLTTWRHLILNEMNLVGDSWECFVSCTLTDDELDAYFDSGYGGTCGEPFTLWTKKRVYFPVTYDGAEVVKSVSRKPDGKHTDHVGGG